MNLSSIPSRRQIQATSPAHPHPSSAHRRTDINSQLYQLALGCPLTQPNRNPVKELSGPSLPIEASGPGASMGSFVFQWCVSRSWAMATNCGAATKLSTGKPRESFDLKTRSTSALTIGPGRLTSRQPRHHPAQEVYVTGTFDDWAKSIKLENKGAHFEKVVELPLSNEKIFYKVRYPTAPPFKIRDSPATSQRLN